jgi:hypothetical protein
MSGEIEVKKLESVEDILGADRLQAIEDSYQEFTRKKELATLEHRDRLDNLLRNLNSEDLLELDVAGVKIPIKRALDARLKRMMATIETEQDGYEFMAAICKEAPENNPLYWQTVDEETGRVAEIAARAVKLMEDEAFNAAGFRPARRPATGRNVQGGRGPSGTQAAE